MSINIMQEILAVAHGLSLFKAEWLAGRQGIRKHHLYRIPV